MSWQQHLADVLRTLAIVAAGITAGISVRVAVDQTYRSVSQLCRFLGLAFLCVGLALGEYHSIGRPPLWPVLILLWIGLGFSLAGTLPLAKSQIRSESLKSVKETSMPHTSGNETHRRRIEADPAAIEEVGLEYHLSHRLGRHVEHDPRSRDYAHKATPGRVLKSVRHARHIPILNQGDIGSCTGNSATGNLGTSGVFDGLPPTHPTLNETLALGIYSDAEKIDGGKGLPGEDEGSSGLSAAKATNARGLCGTYKHALSVDDAMDALQDGPLMTGMDWHTDMDNPDAHGLVQIGGSIRGGHEPMIDEYVCAGDPYADGVIAPEPIIGLPNSWDETWGYQGRFYMTVANFRKLMAADGDVTILTPLNAPVPTPTPQPTPPAPTPVPVPPVPGQGGASFPGSSALVDQHVVAAAHRAGLSVDAWLEHHFESYFDLAPQ